MPWLQELNLYGNKISDFRIPSRVERLLCNLRTLDLGFNDLAVLPDGLDRLSALRTLRVSNNFLCKIPANVCCMTCLKFIEVTCNPIVEPPVEICERGLKSMKLYWYDHHHDSI